MINVLPSIPPVILVAEYIRQDPGGKLTILGLYISKKLVVPETNKLPFVIPLSVCYAFIDGSGDFAVEITITSPKGEIPVDTKGTIQKQRNQSMALIAQTLAFPVTEWGEYKIDVRLDGSSYLSSITIGPAK